MVQVRGIGCSGPSSSSTELLLTSAFRAGWDAAYPRPRIIKDASRRSGHRKFGKLDRRESIRAEPLDAVSLVLCKVALEPGPLAIALRGEDVGA
jgi:hypothetical protein